MGWTERGSDPTGVATEGRTGVLRASGVSHISRSGQNTVFFGESHSPCDLHNRGLKSPQKELTLENHQAHKGNTSTDKSAGT